MPALQFYTDPSENLVELGGLRFSVYIVLAHVGFLVGTASALWRARRFELSRWRMAVVLATSYVGAVVLARGFSVVFDGHLEHYLEHPGQMFQLWRGGFVLYGGLLGGVLAAAASARALRLRFGPCMDTCAPGVAAGLAIARVGCFVTGCCYGTPTRWILGIENRNFARAPRPVGVPLHPAALYEAAGLVVISAILWSHGATRDRDRPSGSVFLLFLLLYAVLRFVVEFFRADARGTVLGLPTSQALSLMIAPCLAITLAWRRRSFAQ